MMDPKLMEEMVARAVGARMGDSKDLEARAEQARRSFSATMYAIESNCQCEGCQLLREAMAILRVRPKGQEEQHGADLHPAPRTEYPAT